MARTNLGPRPAGRLQNEGSVFEALTTAAILSSLAAAPTEGQAAGFRRGTPQVATEATRPAGRQVRVSRESLAIAACRARAGRHGEATYKDLRLAGYRTFLVTGTIAPNRSEQRRLGRGPWTFRCTVRGEGEILDFKAGPAKR